MLNEFCDLYLVETRPIYRFGVVFALCCAKSGETFEIVAVCAHGVLRKTTLSGEVFEKSCYVAIHAWNRRKMAFRKKSIAVQYWRSSHLRTIQHHVSGGMRDRIGF